MLNVLKNGIILLLFTSCSFHAVIDSVTNVGTGVGLFQSVTGVLLDNAQFRTLTTSTLSLVQSTSTVSIDLNQLSSTFTTSFNEGDGSTITFTLSSVGSWNLIKIPAFNQTIGAKATNVLTSTSKLPSAYIPSTLFYFPVTITNGISYYHCHVEIDTQGVLYILLSLNPSLTWPAGASLSIYPTIVPWFK